MLDTTNHDKVVKICPFRGHPCLEDKCKLWLTLSVTTPSSIVGLDRRTEAGVCTFQALLQAISILVNKPPVVIGGRQPMAHPGGLNQ